MKTKTLAAVAAVLLIASGTPAVAQNMGTTTGDPYATEEPREERDHFPWGLLGLLGLAGLLGMKRRDRDDDHRRTTTGTGTNR